MEREDIIPALRAIHRVLETLACYVKQLTGDHATVAEEIDGELQSVKEAVESLERGGTAMRPFDPIAESNRARAEAAADGLDRGGGVPLAEFSRAAGRQIDEAETANLGAFLMSKGKAIGLLITAVRCLTTEVEQQRARIEALERELRETREAHKA